MFLLFFWQIMSEGSLASSFLRAFSWLTDPAPLGFFRGYFVCFFLFPTCNNILTWDFYLN